MESEKKLDEINNEIGKVIRLFAVRGKYRLIGSNSLRSIQYGVDYDVETHLTSNPALSLQHAYHQARADPNTFVVELKCGIDERLQYDGDYTETSIADYLASHPLISEKTRKEILEAKGEDRIDLVRDLFILRWSPEDVAEGRIRLIDGSYKSLQESVMDKSTMKIDLIVKVGNQFAEVSENYYIQVGKSKNYEAIPTKLVIKTLEEDIHYYSKKDSFKSLKRLFSLYRIRREKEKMAKLVDFFNGQVGYLNKIKNELSLLETLFQQTFRQVAWSDISANLQFIKEQISHVYEIPIKDSVFESIDKATIKDVQQIVHALRDYFAEKINLESKEFLRTFI